MLISKLNENKYVQSLYTKKKVVFCNVFTSIMVNSLFLYKTCISIFVHDEGNI